MGERHIPSAASACSPPLQTLREAGGSWADIWGRPRHCGRDGQKGLSLSQPRCSAGLEIQPGSQTSLFPPGSAAAAQSSTAPRSLSAAVEIPCPVK